MFSFLKSLFKSDKDKLSSLTTKKTTVREAKKEPFYHEIVGDTVRIYSRQDGLVEEVVATKPLKEALSLLKKYNKGAA